MQHIVLFVCTVCSITMVVLQIISVQEPCVVTVDIVTYGDSLTAAHASGRILQCDSGHGFGYQQYIYNKLRESGVHPRIHNLGINSQTSAQIAARVTSALQTDYLLFLMGTNDLPTWKTPENNRTVVDAIAYALAQQPLVRRGRVLVGTIPPECAGFPRANPGAAEALNQALIRDSREKQTYEVVDIYAALVIPGTRYRHPAYCLPDLLHFTDAANQVVGHVFAHAIATHPLSKQ